MNNFFEIGDNFLFQDHLVILAFLSILAVATTILIIFSKKLAENVVLLTLLSLIACMMHLVWDAPDVAMTEAAIGACITTVIMLMVIRKCGAVVRINKPKLWMAIIFSLPLFVGMSVIYSELFQYASPDNPIHSHAAEYYLQNNCKDIGIESVVAGILASYRGFDTLGETLVIFTAGVCLLTIFRYIRNENAQ